MDERWCTKCGGIVLDGERIFRDETHHVEAKCKDCGRSYGFKRTLSNDDFKMLVGQYKGHSITSLSDNYLKWGVGTFKGNVLRRFKEELENRGIKYVIQN